MSIYGIKKYKDIIFSVCNVKNLDRLNQPEKDGCLGIAMVISFMKGVSSGLQDFSKHLGVSYGELADPFYRLRDNGVFSFKYDVKNDDVLKGRAINSVMPNAWMEDKHRTEIEWAYIAGIAAGLTGLRNSDDIEKYS